MELVEARSGMRVVVVGPGALDAGCALMRAGVMEVSIVRLDGHVGAGAGTCRRAVRPDAVVAPRPGCLDAALQAVRMCGRMLAPAGSVVLGGLELGWVAPLRAELERLGFRGVASWSLSDGYVLRAGLQSAAPCEGRVA